MMVGLKKNFLIPFIKKNGENLKLSQLRTKSNSNSNLGLVAQHNCYSLALNLTLAAF